MDRVTLKDVADAVGVNISTASRALSSDRSSLVNDATRAKVVEAAERLGYRGNVQASALRRGRTGAIGVIVADLSNPFIGPVIRGVANGLGGRGLLPIMTESRDSSDELRRICDRLLAQRVDGIIITAGRYRDRTRLKLLAEETPTVLAVRQLPSSGIPTISHDDVTGGKLAAEHLLALGHRQVAQLMGPTDIWSFEGRAKGFRQTIENAGGQCIDVEAAIHLPTVEAGIELTDIMLDKTGSSIPTAVFAHNDSIAIGTIGALRRRGFDCPEDISVVGYNDVPLTGHVMPPLTTVRLPAYDLGRLAAELVVTLIDGTRNETKAGDRTETAGSIRTVTLAPELVVRDSTRALKTTQG